MLWKSIQAKGLELQVNSRPGTRQYRKRASKEKEDLGKRPHTSTMNNIQRLKKDYPWIQTPLVVGAPMRLIALADMAVEISKAGT
jgi:hypothetical protein